VAVTGTFVSKILHVSLIILIFGGRCGGEEEEWGSFVGLNRSYNEDIVCTKRLNYLRRYYV
jgi:hypothetical protein